MEGLIIATIIIMILRYQPLIDTASLLDGSLMASWLIPLVAERLPAAVQSAMNVLDLSKA